MEWKYLAMLLLIVLFSCDKNTIYKQFDSGFEDNRWQRDDIRNYEFSVEHAKNYDLYVDFSYVAEVQFAQIPIIVEITVPDGKTTEERLTILTKDAQGSELGDCAGDYCDLRQSVFKNRGLAAGTYKVRLRNQFENEYLPNVIGIGIRLTAVE
jgi:gliding motility-associated lipoprotein GldH